MEKKLGPLERHLHSPIIHTCVDQLFATILLYQSPSQPRTPLRLYDAMQFNEITEIRSATGSSFGRRPMTWLA